MSKRRDVVLATKALVAAALVAGGFASAELRGFDEEYTPPANGGAGGTALGTVGNPEEPEVDLSPLRYNYQLPIGIELLAPTGAASASTAIDAMAAAIGSGVAANRTLGGLADWVDVTILTEDETTIPNAPSQRWGQFAIMIEFATSNPLGT